jgi:plasmid maintenance system antidote protein VapI
MPRPRKPRVDLTPEQAAALARLYHYRPDLTTAQLARRFGIARGSVAAIVARQGIALRAGRAPIPPEEVGHIVELYRDHSLRVHEIAQLVGRNRMTIHRLVKRVLPPGEWRGSGRYPNHRRRYRYRPDLFADPLPEEEMWLLGLLMADGSTDGVWRVVLRLAVSDRDAIEAARRIAGSEAPITVGRSSASPSGGGACQDLAGWALDSTEVVARLTRLGMRRAKSHRSDVTVPASVAASPAFWRGLIDGDGTICWNRSRSGDRQGRRQAWLQVLGGEALEDVPLAVELRGGDPVSEFSQTGEAATSGAAVAMRV